MSLSIGSREFKSQKQAIQFCKEMLNRYRPGDRVNPEDSAFLEPLLERHHEYDIKLGSGLHHFEVMANVHGTQCFRIVRPDGTGTSFSYVTCVSGKAPPQKTVVLSAFRSTIQLDSWLEKKRLFKEYGNSLGLIPCAVTKKLISPDEGHMDHRPPLTFEVIVRQFLIGRGLTWDAVPLSKPADDQKTECTDRALVEAFQDYHQKSATLDFVCKKENLAQASKNRIKKVR